MKTKDFFLFTLFLLLSIRLVAVTHLVGAQYTYISPNSLYLANVINHGDTIEIEAATYSGTDALAAWNKNNLVIKGINGKPHLVAAGSYIMGKGIWVLVGNNITVENIEFSGATVPDENGAGIRLDGTGMTVRHCYFHDNENGILTSNPEQGDILIEYSEFNHNGFGDGYSHNLYIGKVNKLTFRYNYSHHAYIGHNLKSRAKENYILYNRIMDEESGQSSRLIDLPNGGLAVIMGNLLMQGPLAENNNLIGYGLEGLIHPIKEIYCINNTMVNKRVASCIFIQSNAQTEVVWINNNIFGGTGTPVSGPVNQNFNNLIETEIDSLYFINEPNFDYHLTENSPAVNFGTEVANISQFILTPYEQYVHPYQVTIRMIQYEIDAGAYEYFDDSGMGHYNTPSQIVVYPNPSQDQIHVKLDPTTNIETRLMIYDISGKAIHCQDISIGIEILTIPIQHLKRGVYFIQIEDHQFIKTQKFIKL